MRTRRKALCRLGFHRFSPCSCAPDFWIGRIMDRWTTKPGVCSECGLHEHGWYSGFTDYLVVDVDAIEKVGVVREVFDG